MARLSILIGTLLVILALVGYFLQDGVKSSTALIPVIFGLPLILSGLVATMKPAFNMHAMHVSVLFAFLGTLGGLGMGLPKLLSGEPLARPLATGSQVTMGVICLVFVVFCVRSFINARRNRA